MTALAGSCHVRFDDLRKVPVQVAFYVLSWKCRLDRRNSLALRPLFTRDRHHLAGLWRLGATKKRVLPGVLSSGDQDPPREHDSSAQHHRTNGSRYRIRKFHTLIISLLRDVIQLTKCSVREAFICL